MPIIKVENVSKKFRLGSGQSLRETLVNGIARLRRKGTPVAKEFDALREVSFSIEAGEVVGIIGHNGAGKSTMLKLLAGISQPSHGRVSVAGRVAPLIEVGAGLVAELTGRENIYLNGVILGMKREEIRRKFDDIVAFAELERFIDTPLKRYSSGMQVRLGFAIATAVQSDILIVDEVLAVGDLAFQRKCYDRIQSQLTEQGCTVLLVSHDLREIERMCRRALLLDHGHLVLDGPPLEVCNAFYDRSQAKIRADRGSTVLSRGHVAASGDVDLLELALTDDSGAGKGALLYEAPFRFRLRIRALRDLTDVTLALGIRTADFLRLATSPCNLRIERLPRGEHEISARFDRMPFLPGTYSLALEISEGTPNHGVFVGENLFDFRVSAGPRHIPLVSREGFIELNGTWHRGEATPAMLSERRKRAP